MRTILPLLLMLSVLTGIAAQARAAEDPDDATVGQQQDWKRNWGL